MKVRIFLLLSLIILTVLNCNNNSNTLLDSKNEEKIESLISQMTLEEKIGQMSQVDIRFIKKPEDIYIYGFGSILSGGGAHPPQNTSEAWAELYDSLQTLALKSRLKIPIIYGIDAVHGHNNVMGSVIFPHNIGLGATRDPDLVKKAARITAIEVSATGIDWTFAPCVAVTRDERWGRTYESFGEVPDLVSIMSRAAVEGYQGDNLSNITTVVACAKHFIGDGGTTNGVDRGNTEIDEKTLREIHLPPYKAAVDEGVATIMVSYSSWNGTKCHASKYLITDLLKEEIGFKGIVVSDYAAIDQIPGDYRNDIKTAINAGIDMVMIPDKYEEFISLLTDLVKKGEVPEERINDAVRRILRVKFALGLFNDPFSHRELLSKIGSDEHRQIARECVRKSIVLLKNENKILPLSKYLKRIHISGKNANDIGNQCGGWTISWQGSSGDITKGTTIYEAIKKSVSDQTKITFSIDGLNAEGADVAIAVLGETPYAEMQGDRQDLHLDSKDLQTLENLKNSGVPIIVILVTGRPLIITEQLKYIDALLVAWLPGTEGEGVTDILFGDYSPTGKLPISWPASMDQIPINIGDKNYNPLFKYGFGLSY
ncbi:MAG: glycoside hydrolase family 3 C-terminal domain-containing protein [Candidatus Marinimicrobia bacterium]|nr:glycoside hydrolase family 3 C-terminal domain-containing protein [Candidatus Neomarinimicrobiota bacterium]